jgi:hypothetical protein
MNHAQKYLAQADRQITELTVQIARQRVIVNITGITLIASETVAKRLELLLPRPENTSDLANFESRHGAAPRFAGKGREIAAG